jgi:hypothetical protein
MRVMMVVAVLVALIAVITVVATVALIVIALTIVVVAVVARRRGVVLIAAAAELVGGRWESKVSPQAEEGGVGFGCGGLDRVENCFGQGRRGLDGDESEIGGQPGCGGGGGARDGRCGVGGGGCQSGHHRDQDAGALRGDGTRQGHAHESALGDGGAHQNGNGLRRQLRTGDTGEFVDNGILIYRTGLRERAAVGKKSGGGTEGGKQPFVHWNLLRWF